MTRSLYIVTLHLMKYANQHYLQIEGKLWEMNDGIPIEVLNNRNCMVYLTRLFNTCLGSSTVPELWSRGIIKPILKNFNDDPGDPLNYRSITITSSVYKLYCSILNKRLANCVEIHGIICDEQNGFRAGRSTIDHICSISYIVETRLKKARNTCGIY